MVVNAARNIGKLIIGFIWHVVIIESYIRLKWLKQHIHALSLGFKSHAEYMQFLLSLGFKSHAEYMQYLIDLQKAKKQQRVI